jgi:hypothetical protein
MYCTTQFDTESLTHGQAVNISILTIDFDNTATYCTTPHSATQLVPLSQALTRAVKQVTDYGISYR